MKKVSTVIWQRRCAYDNAYDCLILIGQRHRSRQPREGSTAMELPAALVIFSSVTPEAESSTMQACVTDCTVFFLFFLSLQRHVNYIKYLLSSNLISSHLCGPVRSSNTIELRSNQIEIPLSGFLFLASLSPVTQDLSVVYRFTVSGAVTPGSLPPSKNTPIFYTISQSQGYI